MSTVAKILLTDAFALAVGAFMLHDNQGAWCLFPFIYAIFCNNYKSNESKTGEATNG